MADEVPTRHMANQRLIARKVVRKHSQKQVNADAEKYREKALELGASDARVIPASYVVVDERVRLRCAVPRCHLYGESANCPPYTPSPSEMRKALRKYTCAIVFISEVSPKSDFVDDEKWHVGHMNSEGDFTKTCASSGVDCRGYNLVSERYDESGPRTLLK